MTRPAYSLKWNQRVIAKVNEQQHETKIKVVFLSL